MSGLIGLTSIATNDAFGAISRAISSRFWPRRSLTSVMPVALPPGLPRLATNPAPTGSNPTTNTIGILAVAALAESAAGGDLGAENEAVAG